MLIAVRIPRAAAAIALAVGIGLGTAGCSFLTPIATLNQYNPSDGVNASIGDLDVRNAVGIINADGHAINLLITLVNNGGSKTVTLQYPSGDAKAETSVTLQAGEVKQFGNAAAGEDQIIILNPPVKAGQLLPVYVQYGTEPGKTVMVPILDGKQAEYEGLVPAAILRNDPTE
jgi:hypothetical protein